MGADCLNVKFVRDVWPRLTRFAPPSLQVEVAAHLPLLPQLATQLQQTSAQIEEAVTGVCGAFQSMVTRAQASVASAESIAGAQHEADGAGLLATLQTARSAFDVLLDRLSSAAERARVSADRVHGLKALAVGVEKGISQVDSIAMNVRLLALNAKIEAARDGDRSAGFSVVATEMERCAGQSSDIAESVRTTAQELTTTLRSVADALAQEADRAAADMAASRAGIEAALQGVERAHAAISAQLTDAGRMSRDFAREISAAVMALQFQDRVSQRIGHVVEALTDMHDALESAGRLPANGALGALAQERRDAVAKHVNAAHTMAEERQLTVVATAATVATVASNEPAAGDVELF